MPAVFDQRWQCLNEHLDHALDLAEPERIAVDQFMTSVGADNPATNTARELALGH